MSTCVIKHIQEPSVRLEVELSRNSTAVIAGNIPDFWYVMMHGEKLLHVAWWGATRIVKSHGS